MIEDYKMLTKTTTDNAGQSEVQCAYKKSETCLIHKNRCNQCPVFKAILMQLNAFETVYMEAEHAEPVCGDRITN